MSLGNENDLRRDRLAAVASMAAIVSHAARNKLATLRGALELLKAGLEDGFSQEYRDLLLRECDEFIGDFNLGADMLRCDFGALEAVSGREAVEDALQRFGARAARGRVTISAAFAHEKDRIAADRRLLRLVLLNLLRNAEEALEGAASPRIEVRTMNEGDRLHVEVADNGPGVPPAIRDRLFDETIAAREDGIGLGLSISGDAMALMHGSIRCVAPPEGAGACFRVSVPLSGA